MIKVVDRAGRLVAAGVRVKFAAFVSSGAHAASRWVAEAEGVVDHALGASVYINGPEHEESFEVITTREYVCRRTTRYAAHFAYSHAAGAVITEDAVDHWGKTARIYVEVIGG